MSRRMKWIGAGAVLLAAAAAVFVVLNRTDNVDVLPGGEDARDPAVETGANAAAAFVGGPPELLMMSGTTLQRRDIKAQTEENLAELPTADVHAALGSNWVAYVTSEQPPDAEPEDFVAEPTLHVFNPDGDVDEVVGPGVSPRWNATGTALAYLRPAEPRDCSGEQCPGKVALALYDPETQTDRTLLKPRGWRILMWSGSRVLVSDAQDLSKTISVNQNGDVIDLDVPPSELWDASPDGRWLIRTAEGAAEFLPLVEGNNEGDPIPIDLPEDRRLGEGAWSPDSGRVAAILLAPDPGGPSPSVSGGGKDQTQAKAKKGKGSGKNKPQPADLAPASELAIFSPDRPTTVLVEASDGVSGPVLWSVESDFLLFARLIDPVAGLFQAAYCPVEATGVCLLATSWTQSVALLRME